MTIPEIFERFGEPYFRDGERRVIARLLDDGPQGAGDRRRRLHERGDARAHRRARRLDLAEAGVRDVAAPRAQALQPAAAADRRPRGDAAPAARTSAARPTRSPTSRSNRATARMTSAVEALIGALRRRLAAAGVADDARGRGRPRRARLPHPDRRRPDRQPPAPHIAALAPGRALRDRHRRDGRDAASRRRCGRASRPRGLTTAGRSSARRARRPSPTPNSRGSATR